MSFYIWQNTIAPVIQSGCHLGTTWRRILPAGKMLILCFKYMWMVSGLMLKQLKGELALWLSLKWSLRRYVNHSVSLCCFRWVQASIKVKYVGQLLVITNLLSEVAAWKHLLIYFANVKTSVCFSNDIHLQVYSLFVLIQIQKNSKI